MSTENDFDIRTKLGIDPPCYVRKVDRPTSCGAKEDPPERRAALIEENVLSEDGGVLSLLYVTHSTDVIRAAMALNWCRTGGTRVEGLCLLAFILDELEGVAKDQTTDSFACHWARQNHWNITLAIPDRGRVANVLANRNRFPKNFTRSKMKEAYAAVRADGCRSTDSDSSNCICESMRPRHLPPAFLSCFKSCWSAGIRALSRLLLETKRS